MRARGCSVTRRHCRVPQSKERYGNHGGGNFAPTDVEELDGLYYVTTGYSNLDYVLTARILATSPFDAIWNDLTWGGKGNEHGQFQIS